MMTALQKRPLAVAVQADKIAFQNYKSGVVSSGCGTNVNHAVVIVGYGTDTTLNQNYFLVRNSWGPRWGDAGHIKIAFATARNLAGSCGINMYVYSATAALI